jgi:hypothetical protein
VVDQVAEGDRLRAGRHVGQVLADVVVEGELPSRARRATERAVNCLDIEPMSKTEDGEIGTACSRLPSVAAA